MSSIPPGGGPSPSPVGGFPPLVGGPVVNPGRFIGIMKWLSGESHSHRDSGTRIPGMQPVGRPVTELPTLSGFLRDTVERLKDPFGIGQPYGEISTGVPGSRVQQPKGS